MAVSRFDVLKYLLSKLQTINGKKALQKIVYFINEKLDLSYHYMWWAYGPFSKELYDDLDFLLLLGYAKYDHYNFVLMATDKLKRERIRLERNLTQEIDNIISRLKEYTGLDPRKLELLASLYFLRNSYSGIENPQNPDELYMTLNLLKKDKFGKEEVLEAIEHVKDIEKFLKNS